jgi:hypothetical protein
MADNLTNQDWRSIAAQASTEQDPAKLTRLVAELCRSLDQRGGSVTQEPESASSDNSKGQSMTDRSSSPCDS